MHNHIPPIVTPVVPLRVMLDLLSDLCPDCQAKVRSSIARYQSNGRSNRRPTLEIIMEEATLEYNFTVSELLNGGNSKALVNVRREVSKRARALHYTFAEIGAALHRHHSSIVHLVRT